MKLLKNNFYDKIRIKYDKLSHFKKIITKNKWYKTFKLADYLYFGINWEN